MRAETKTTCSQCGKTLRARVGIRGKKVKCPRCGESVPVPCVLPWVARVVGRARPEAHHDQCGAASERVLRLVEEHVRAEARRVPQVRAPRGRLLHAEGEAVAPDDDPIRLPLGAGRRREREQPEHGDRCPLHAQRAGSHTGSVTRSVSRSKTTRTFMPKVISAGVARTM